MKLCIRAHDLGVQGIDAVRDALSASNLDGVQLVAYKVCPGLAYEAGALTEQTAESIGKALMNTSVPLIGAYFNPVHSSQAKREKGEAVFSDYLRYARLLGSSVVASETGSYSDEPWVYHPNNRTEEALQSVVAVFSRLCDIGQDYGAWIAMEGAAGHVCWSPEVLDRTQRIMGRSNTKVIFDLYNYMDEENQADYLNILDRGLELFAGRIHAFHMKDCCFQNGTKPKQVPFGTGQMDMTQVLRRIKAYDPEATLVLEGTTPPHIEGAAAKIRSIWEAL